MSGYLARMVASAQRPGGSFHPVRAAVGRGAAKERRDEILPGGLEEARSFEIVSEAREPGSEGETAGRIIGADLLLKQERGSANRGASERASGMGGEISRPETQGHERPAEPLVAARRKVSAVGSEKGETRTESQPDGSQPRTVNAAALSLRENADPLLREGQTLPAVAAETVRSGVEMTPGTESAKHVSEAARVLYPEPVSSHWESASVSAEQAVVWPAPLQPLLPDPTTVQPAQAARPAVVMPMGRPNPDEQRQRRDAPDRKADEIQIHIGRIEVTAAPPAPVRSAPTAMRKTPSLDEYLRRGNGRA